MKTSRDHIMSFYHRNHRMPSYAEIMTLTGYKTKSAVAYMVKKLIFQGVLSKDRQGKLIPIILGGIKVLGLVEAGFPSPAEEDLADRMSFDDYLIGNKEATYILRVKGDSMIDAGICEGDMVVVERTTEYKDRDIVIAEIDGQWTIKYLRKRGSKVWLEPANKNYKPIYPTQELQISAKVTAVVRKY